MNRKRVFIKRLLSLLFTCVFMASISIDVYAYKTTGYIWNSSNINYYYDNYNTSRGQAFFAEGVTAWNNANVDATISFSSGSGFCITEVSNSSVQWDGITNLSLSWGYISTGTIVAINMAATTTWNDNGALKSVIVHEIGHVLGLGENGTTQTIMNAGTWGANSRYGGYSLTTPQSDDKNGINAIY